MEYLELAVAFAEFVRSILSLGREVRMLVNDRERDELRRRDGRTSGPSADEQGEGDANR